MNTDSSVMWEKTVARLIGAFVLIFLAYFIISQWSGLVRLFDWILEGVLRAPEAAANVAAHYAALPAAVLLQSLLVGAAFGVVTTVPIVLAARGIIEFPRLRRNLALAGLASFALLLTLEVPLVPAMIGGIAVGFGAGLIAQPEARAAFWGAEARQRLLSPKGLRAVAQGGGIGFALGAVGSQVLALPTQHCTFAPEAAPLEYQFGLLITMAGTLLLLIPAWTLLRGRLAGQVDAATSGYFRGWLLPILFLAPMLLNLLLFLYYPSAQTVTLSLFSRRFPLPQERFVCLGNYAALAGDLIYRNSFIITVIVTVAIVALSLAISLGIAVLASQKVRGASIYRTLLIWPFALSPIVAGVIFLAMFREGQSGLINGLLYALTGNTVSWLRDPNLARVTIVLASVWNILGFNILFYVAGLQNIPSDLLEAAQIDGANRVQRFFRVTFPLLAPFTFFLLVTNVTYSFYGIYGVVDTLTQGGPPIGAAGIDGGATEVLIFKLYQDAFRPGSPIGSAAAQAVILFLMVAGFTVLQFRTIERRITYGE